MSVSATCGRCTGTVTFPDRHAGRRETCPHCGAAVDMPGSAPEPETPAAAPAGGGPEAGASPRRLCPACREPLGRGVQRCPRCGALYALARSDRRLKRDDPVHLFVTDPNALDRMSRQWGVWGGIALMAIGAGLFALGLAIARFVVMGPVLVFFGLILVGSAIASARRRKRLAMRRARREAE